MQDVSDCEDAIIAILVKDFNVDPAIVSAATLIKRDLGLDDDDWTYFIGAVEKRFCVILFWVEVQSFKTVGDVAKAISWRVE